MNVVVGKIGVNESKVVVLLFMVVVVEVEEKGGGRCYWSRWCWCFYVMVVTVLLES